MSLTSQLGIDVPVVLGPFGGLSSVDLTTAVSESAPSPPSSARGPSGRSP